MPLSSRMLWRVFPWDAEAPDGGPFSRSFVPAAQGSGRFDRRHGRVLYLSESPEHAVAEKLQRFRGSEIEPAELTEFGRPLALVAVEPAPDVFARIADLCDPDSLAAHAIAPDRIAAHAAATSQGVATVVEDAGFGGLRWWSVFRGEWHTVVLFLADRADPAWFARPELLQLDHSAVVTAARALGIRNTWR